jgi:hypothetical protein
LLINNIRGLCVGLSTLYGRLWLFSHLKPSLPPSKGQGLKDRKSSEFVILVAIVGHHAMLPVFTLCKQAEQIVIERSRAG